ncbi:unnamed protein product [Sphagnum troendelagicum]|jgi:hypothetical protein
MGRGPRIILWHDDEDDDDGVKANANTGMKRERERERENWEKTRTMIVKQEEVRDVPGPLRDIPRGYWGCSSMFAGCWSAAFA